MLDLDMTPYAAFVWPAWGVSALVLAALTARAVSASRKWKRELDRLDTAADEAARPQVAQSAIGQKK
ncbi:heme exporter protein CcmD [Brevundimonas intermedia]|uniref:heme exporter protein CcmD n=1 Tax=Brevundimonas intermedia TaxID=74315 RepID=UPI00320ADF26